jgi:hypothetical protein
VAVAEGERVAVRISSREPVRARIVDEPLPGFEVSRADLPEALGRPDAGVTVATSRHGAPLSVARLSALAPAIGSRGLTVAFGAPGRGLPEILDLPVEAVSGWTPPPVDSSATAAAGGDVGADADADADGGTEGGDEVPGGFDRWLDTIPDQGSEVVRTEEAMFATLAALRLPAR